MRIINFVIFILLCNLIQAQIVIDGITCDTSFTVQSAFRKEVKSRPFIRIATVEENDKIQCFENIPYLRFNDRKSLNMNIYRPKDDNRYPALLMIHGGGWSSGNLNLQIPMAREIATRGYITIPVEYRLSPEAKYPAALHDLKAAVRWIRENAELYHIDTARIAVSGCSAGGQLASLIGATNGQKAYEGDMGNKSFSSLVHAVINIDGSLDFTNKDGIERVSSDLEKGKLPASVRWLGATIDQRSDIWIAASPLFQVSCKSASTCFINSSIPRFHEGRDEMIDKLSEYGIYSEVHTIDSTPHPFWLFHPWFNQTVDIMIRFLDKIFPSK